jgi:hypothetical protein
MGNQPNSRPAAADAIFCQHAKDLLEALTGAIRQLVTLHEEQFQAVIGGDLESSRFKPLINAANDRKHDAKQAYISHLMSHHCSSYHGQERDTSERSEGVGQ